MSFQSKHGADFYNRPMQKMVRVLVQNTNNLASKEYTFKASGQVYYAHIVQGDSVEVEMNARWVTKTEATINIRNWPPLTTLDRLLDLQFKEEYIITSVARGQDELLVKGYSLEAKL